MKRLLFFAVLLMLANQVFAESFDWPQWRGPNGDGTTTETGWNPMALKDGAKILWTTDVGLGYSNVAIKYNRLYTMGLSDSVLAFSCLDATTGKVIWRSPVLNLSMAKSQSTPATDGDRVYGLGADGSLFCLQASDGTVLWVKNLQNDFKAKMPIYNWATSPIIDGKLLLLNAHTLGIALDKYSGDLVWATSVTSDRQALEGSYTTAVICALDGTRCALFLGPEMLTIVDLTTGKTLWSYAHGDRCAQIADPIVFGGKVLIQFNYSCIQLEVKGAEQQVQWTTSSFSSFLSAGVLVNGYLYGSAPPSGFGVPMEWADMERTNFAFICIDWITGDVLWEKQMKYVSTTAVGEKLLLLEVSGTLHIAEATPSGYQVLSSADVLGGKRRPRTFVEPPVLCNGKIYCRNYAGDLVCIDVSK